MEMVEDLYLGQASSKKAWESFLTDRGIHIFSESEVATIDETIGIYQNDELMATGSIAGNIIKYVAACDKGSEKGVRFNAILTELINRLTQKGIFHIMVFTKPMYTASFEHVGFKTLASTDYGVLLEKGPDDIQHFVNSIEKPADLAEMNVASIVMNANPFTKGHRYLIEQAAEENELVYVFAVHQNASLFTTQERIELIRLGTADLKNVIIVDGGDYMVSYATFPAYFINSDVDTINYQTELDALLFKKKIAPGLNIRKRYLGSEPESKTTALYNETLKRVLSDQIDVHIVERQVEKNQRPISASAVRRAIQANDLSELPELVPSTTETFIKENLNELQKRMTKG